MWDSTSESISMRIEHASPIFSWSVQPTSVTEDWHFSDTLIQVVFQETWGLVVHRLPAGNS